MRDVSCVTCRACDVARDRSIGRESGEERVSGGRGDFAKIPSPSSSAVPLVPACAHLVKCFMRRSDNYVFLNKFWFYFRQRAEFAHGGPKSAPFSYTCRNFHLFLGKSPAFFKILKNRFLSRTRVQSVVSYKHVCDDLSSGHGSSTA